MGDPKDSNNVFQWSKVRLNLPGQSDYDPAWPWVAKTHEDRKLATDTFQYVDNVRPTGNDKSKCWDACHTFGSWVNYLGLQDAPRKCRPHSRSPGPWAGSMVETNGETISVLIAQEKWEKWKRLLGNIFCCLDPQGAQLLPFKKLESARGYLVYTTRTYPSMVPYLKGIHLTLDIWRDGWAEDGWQTGQSGTSDSTFFTAPLQDPDTTFDPQDFEGWTWNKEVGLRTYRLESATHRSTPPSFVKAVPRLRDDVNALMHLMKASSPHR